MKHLLYTDGGCEPNPGHCAAGAVLINQEDESIVYLLSEYIGMGTNNLGELTAILHGVQRAKEIQVTHLEVLSDSELCVNLCNKTKTTKKEHLTPILSKILCLVGDFQELTFTWIKGHANHKWNEFADRLCSNAIAQALQLPIPVPQAAPTAPTAARTYVEYDSDTKLLLLNCPFAEKDTVKQLGARWNKEEKKWVSPDTPENRKKFSKWI